MNISLHIYEKIYTKLIKLAPGVWQLNTGDSLKSKSAGFMDLSLDVLDKSERYMVIALSHYYEHESGDLIPDPDMEIRITYTGVAEALAYQDTFGFQQVYPDDKHFYPKLKKSLNSFLNTWLSNCLQQGHKLVNNI